MIKKKLFCFLSKKKNGKNIYVGYLKFLCIYILGLKFLCYKFF